MRSRLRKVWRASAYLMLGAAVGVLAWFLVAGLLVVMALALVLVGLPLLPEVVLVLRRFASLERWRAGRVLGVPIAERYTPLTGTLRERLRGSSTTPPPTGMWSGCWCRRSSACSSA